MSDLESQIDALYALPAAEFIAARNALAKALKGDDAARVKRLQKPTAVPWAANQVYWHERPLYEQLMAAGRALRAAQVGAIQGQPADLRGAAATHRAALAAAVAAGDAHTRTAGGSPSTDGLTRMLEALSLASQEPGNPGRFTEVVAPAGFEALAGITPGTALGSSGPPTTHRAAPTSAAGRKAALAADRRRQEAEAAAAREAADRAVAEARRKVEAAREREARGRAQVDLARQQLARAEASLSDARTLVSEASAALERAEADRHRV